MTSRSVPTIAPATITQHTATAHGAPSARWWRDHVPRLGIRYARIGSLVVVRTEDWLAYVASLSAPVAAAADDQDESADDILAGLGYRRAGSGR